MGSFVDSLSYNRIVSFMLLPISAVIATRDRAPILSRALASVSAQGAQPREILVVDASDNDATRAVCDQPPADLASELSYVSASMTGAAVQRNEGVARASQPFILFMDDDVLLEPGCLERLWRALESDKRNGGVNALISNQSYVRPGGLTRILFRALHGRAETSYAGRCLGPAMNLLPENRDSLPEVVPVEWLNLGCTLYRREALPKPAFLDRFKGYSLMEDLALSLDVGKRGWKLANVRTARVFHDSQPGEHKSSSFALGRMELANRHYIMRHMLEKRRPSDYAKLALLETFFLVSALFNRRTWRTFPAVLAGKAAGVLDILSGR